MTENRIFPRSTFEIDSKAAKKGLVEIEVLLYND